MTEKSNRYSRQIRFAPIGESGQNSISEARAVIIGCGALGAASAELLCRAGLGTVHIVDRDIIELHNLQRQILFTEADAEEGLPKAEAAASHLRKINSEITIESTVADCNYDNIDSFVSGATVVIDGTDNFETRQLLNDAAIAHDIPWVYGGAIGADGMVKGVVPGETSCFRCLMSDLPGVGEGETCETAGILASASLSVAALQVGLVIKYLVTGRMDGRLHMLNLWDGSHRTVGVPRLEDCPACVEKNLEYYTGKVGSRATELCGRNTVQVLPASETELDLGQLADRLKDKGELQNRRYYLVFDDGDLSLSIFPDGRCMVHGTSDENRAHAAVARYLGG